jgi:hypothetical protein
MTIGKVFSIAFMSAMLVSLSAKASYYQIEQDTDPAKRTYNLTCYGTANTEFRALLLKPNIKEVTSVLAPTLRVEDTEGTLRVFASYGSSQFVRDLLGIPRSFKITSKSQKWTVGSFKLNDKIALDDLLEEDFSALFYLAQNQDLAAFMPDLQDRNRAGIMHYLNFGYLEDRITFYQDVDMHFDPQSYLDCNPDVAGIARSRPRPLSFAVDHHYVLAAHENRPFIPRIFDVGFYLRVNADVAQAAKASPNPEEFARSHYLNHGRNEAQRLCVVPLELFDATRYYEQNPDVRQALFKDVPYKEKKPGVVTFETKAYNKYAIDHFRNFGYFEGRPH